MLQRYFHDISRQEAEQHVKASKEGFIIRRSSEERGDATCIYSDRGKAEDERSGKAVWYTITFWNAAENSVAHLT